MKRFVHRGRDIGIDVKTLPAIAFGHRDVGYNQNHFVGYNQNQILILINSILKTLVFNTVRIQLETGMSKYCVFG